MKKVIMVLSLLMAVLLMPAAGYAESYTVNNDEMTISFDDPGWTVFTRDNIQGNEALEKLGTDAKTMSSTMEKASAYMVAIKGKSDERIELLVRATENEYINNMNTLSDHDMTALMEGVDENYSGEIDEYESSVVTLGDNKYIKMTGKYDKDDYDVVQFLTFINGKNYLISAQKVINYTKADLKELDGIIEGIEFQMDPSKTENNVEAYVQDMQNSLSSTQKSTPTKIIMTAAVVLVIVFLMWFMNRRRKPRK